MVELKLNFLANIIPQSLIMVMQGLHPNVLPFIPWCLESLWILVYQHWPPICNKLKIKSFNAFVSLILLHPFTIMFLISLTFVHVMCNQLHVFGLKLFILKSTHGSCPWSIYSLMTIIVHVLIWTLKTCFSGHCKITFVSCSSFVQFAKMKITKMLG